MRSNGENRASGRVRISCILFTVLLGIVLCIGTAPSANAQSTGGRIGGTVTDASGGAVAGATISLLNTANGTTRDTTSGSNGEHLFLEVPPTRHAVNLPQGILQTYL